MNCSVCSEPAVSHVEIGGTSRALCKDCDALLETEGGLTFLTLKLDNAIVASKVANETEDAYSCDNYTPDNWKNITLFLLEEGYNQDNVTVILRSKHMRWASDCECTELEDFKKYFVGARDSVNRLLGVNYEKTIA